MPPQFSPNSRYLLLSTLDNTLRVWDFVADKCARQYSGHSCQKLCCFAAFGVHDGTVLTGGEDKCVHVWDLQTGKHLQRLDGAPDAAADAAAPANGGDAAPAAADKHAAPDARAASGEVRAGAADAPSQDGHCDVVCALDVHPKARLLATGALDKDRTIKLWTAEPPGRGTDGGAGADADTAMDVRGGDDA